MHITYVDSELSIGYTWVLEEYLEILGSNPLVMVPFYLQMLCLRKIVPHIHIRLRKVTSLWTCDKWCYINIILNTTAWSMLFVSLWHSFISNLPSICLWLLFVHLFVGGNLYQEWVLCLLTSITPARILRWTCYHCHWQWFLENHVDKILLGKIFMLSKMQSFWRKSQTSGYTSSTNLPWWRYNIFIGMRLSL